MCPIYNYHCPKCDKDYELVVKLGTDKVPCPVCQEEMKKIFDASKQVVIFKGSGWTATPGRQG